MHAARFNLLEDRRGKAQEGVLNGIRAERERQNRIFRNDPGSRHSGEWLAILTKKVGDAAAALLTDRTKVRELEQELIEVAAVAVAWLEDIDANR